MLLPQITTQKRDVVTHSGISLGSVLAVTFSWARNRSILWAITREPDEEARWRMRGLEEG